MGIKTQWVIAAVMIALTLAGCTPPGAVRPGEAFTTRELTPDEKRALSAIISQSLKDPEAARFKWMPVVLRERDGITDYCGLVNGKNSYGGYTGSTRFYGQLIKDNTGQFTQIAVRAIEEPDRETNFIDPRWLNGICEDYGYDNFGLAR